MGRMMRCQNAQIHCFFAAYTRSACCQPSTSYRSVGPSIRITLYTAAAMKGIWIRRDHGSSGSDVRVNSGAARIDLVEGGQVSICGPAHLSVLKSGGSLTIALDTGTVRVHVEQELPLTIYAPLIQAQTVAIGNGPRNALVGFDSSGAMCIRANLGAIRVEQQLTGQ